MATWFGTAFADLKDFSSFGLSNDIGYGKGGNDKIWGYHGIDKLYGQTGLDELYGENGDDFLYGGLNDDKLYGGKNNDTLYGQQQNDLIVGGIGADDIYGGADVDQLWGGNEFGNDFQADSFYFETFNTGSITFSQADTINDFTDRDQIYLKGFYSYAGNTTIPNDGEYSIWQNGSNWVVTYNSPNSAEFHDIIVKGANPLGDISFF